MTDDQVGTDPVSTGQVSAGEVSTGQPPAQPIIKICGVKTIDAARAAAAAGASHIGFVFFEKSPRHIDLETATEIAASGGPVKKVALVVNPPDQLVETLGASGVFDVIQFHGAESAAALTRHRALLPADVEIWKALGVSAREDLKAVIGFDGIVDRFLFDARPPTGADRPGGHGAAFDWSILSAYQAQTPWLLAGGLDPQNVGAAIAAVQTLAGFDGVDVSSGVESARGVKDDALIAAFVAAARAAARR